MNDSTDKTNTEAVEAFIHRWQDTGGKERANYQLFLTELCQLLDLPGPEPAGEDEADNSYVFERRVDIHHPDGSNSRGNIKILNLPPSQILRMEWGKLKAVAKKHE